MVTLFLTWWLTVWINLQQWAGFRIIKMMKYLQYHLLPYRCLALFRNLYFHKTRKFVHCLQNVTHANKRKHNASHSASECSLQGRSWQTISTRFIYHRNPSHNHRFFSTNVHTKKKIKSHPEFQQSHKNILLAATEIIRGHVSPGPSSWSATNSSKGRI